MKLIPWLCGLSFVYAAGCAHHMGQQGSAGALEDFAQKVDAPPGQKPMEAVASRAVKGAVVELSTPEEIARLRKVVDAAADSFRARLTAGLVSDLGSGRGPLADSLTATVERASTRATQGALAPLLATCDLADPSCLDRRLADLSQRSALAFTDGVKRSLGIPALIAAFVLGALTILIIWVLWTIGKNLRASRRSTRSSSRSSTRSAASSAATWPALPDPPA